MNITLSPFKKTLAIYMGITPPFNGLNYHNRNVFGSENSAIKLAESMTDKYNVLVFVWNIENRNEQIFHKNVYYLDSKHINNFKCIDIMIILRYINYFIYFRNLAKKTYLWIEDLIINPIYNRERLPDQAINLLDNVSHNINSLICLSEFHKQNLNDVFDNHNYTNNLPIITIPNPMELIYYKDNIPKIKNRFIYVSAPNRGLDVLLECYAIIKEKVKSCSLIIFRKNDIDENLLNKIKNLEDITLFDKVSHEELANEMLKSEYFFYPTRFDETFCNCAAEAQLYKCICIYNNTGSLNTTIGDRGLEINIIDNDIEEYKIRATEEIIKLMDNEQQKNDYIKRGHEWAKTLDINIIKNTWENLFKK